MPVSFPLVLFIGSPLLGPAVWRSTAAALGALGHPGRVLPAPIRAPSSPHEVLQHLLSVLPPDEPLALVAHSNAGLYVPALVAERDVVASVFADSALPPEAGSAPMSPPGAQRFLQDLVAADGLLPAWTDWWQEEDVAPLFPDRAVRAAVEAEQHRLPLSYFTAALAVPAGWTAQPAAYLAFGDTYRSERDQATGWGWPVRAMPGRHLHPLINPAEVADALDELLRRLL